MVIWRARRDGRAGPEQCVIVFKIFSKLNFAVVKADDLPLAINLLPHIRLERF